jgi:hypothetical protein
LLEYRTMRCTALMLLLVVAISCHSVAAGQEKKRRPKFTIGKETTYVAKPLDADGYIDFATALNERLQQGVTAENNAVVLLWKAFGPRPEGGAMPPAFFRWLGTPEPPPQGDYLIGLDRFLIEKAKLTRPDIDRLYDGMAKYTERPWTAQQFPHIAAWLVANEKPVALAVAASTRAQYYSPLVPGSGRDPGKDHDRPSDLIGAQMPGVQKCREFATALTARAMLAISQERYDDAWQDLLACHRLGRLVARGGTLIDGLVGIAIDSMAAAADQTLLERAAGNPKRIKAWLRGLENLPPMPAMADKVDLTERIVALEEIMMVDRYGLGHLEALAGGKTNKALEEASKRALDGIDLDPGLRSANQWYDRMAAAMRLKDRAAREKQMAQIDGDIKAMKGAAAARAAKAKGLFDPAAPAAERGKMLGELVLGLVIPAHRNVQRAGDRAEQVQRNLHLAFALAAYQRERGMYPPKLDALVPDYLATIPQDLFSGKALIYRPAGNGYLLYSVGANEIDDQGRSFNDNPPGDDLVVRMPQQELQPK